MALARRRGDDRRRPGAGLLLRAATTPTRASSRRSSTSTCRSRSSRWSGFVAAGVLGDHAPAHARRRAGTHRSYVAIHMSVIFGVGVLATGSIWAKASWGKWWVWDEPTLVSFLIVFLLYVDLLPAALLDRGPRAPRALLVGVRDHGRRVRADQLHRGAAGREPRAPARPEHDRRATCPARCGSRSWSRCSAIALLYVTL